MASEINYRDAVLERSDLALFAPPAWLNDRAIHFAMKLLEHGNVAVSPGSGFGSSGDGYLRMALVENEERLRQGVRQIKACLS